MTKIKIGNKYIGDKYPCFIIGELSCNHLQDFNLAVKSVKEMARCGVDAIKLQTYKPESISLSIKNKFFKEIEKGPWKGLTPYEVFKEAYTPWEWQGKIKKIAEKKGLICFSTPFDEEAVDYLEKLDVQAYKIASKTITHIPLLKYIASKGKPVIISTGIASLSDIKQAIDVCKKMGNRKIILLKCNSEYPTPLEEVNLKTIKTLKKTFGKIIGISDHTLGIEVPLAAVAMGAKVIEKHFILDKKINSLDVSFSLEAIDFKKMVKGIRKIEKALGKSRYSLSKNQIKAKKSARSIFAVKNIKKGEQLVYKNNIKIIRPFKGLHPKLLDKVNNKKARVNIKRGTPISWNLIK